MKRSDQSGGIYFSTDAEKHQYEGEKFVELWHIKDNEKPRRLIKWQSGDLNYSVMIVFAQGRFPKGWIAFSPMNIEDHVCATVVLNYGVNLFA